MTLVRVNIGPPCGQKKACLPGKRFTLPFERFHQSGDTSDKTVRLSELPGSEKAQMWLNLFQSFQS